MAFSSIGTLLSQNNKPGGPFGSWSTTTESANLTVGRIGILVIAFQGAGEEITSITDAGSNSWSQIANRQLGGDSGEVWQTKATTSLGSGDLITINFDGGMGAAAATGWVFAITGTSIIVDATDTELGGAGAPSVAITGLSNNERLWIRGDSVTHPLTTYTPDASYTAFDHTGANTTGGSDLSNHSARGEFRIITTTGQTTQPTTFAAPDIGILVALSELVAGGDTPLHYLPSDKTAFVLTNGKTLAGGAADIQTNAIPIGTNHNGVLHTTLQMGAGSATPPLANIELSHNGSDWKTYRTLHGPRTATTFTYTTKIPMGANWVRLNVVSANTGTLTISSYYDFVAGVT